jgi:hypothetical protein
MPVTDQQVAVLRAQLSAQLDEANRLLHEFSSREDVQGFIVLTMAAFTKAVRLRFGSGGTREDAIRLVADVRSRSDRLSAIDPDAAERVLTSVLTHSDFPELDPDELRSIFAIFLSAMIDDVGLSGSQLDVFLAKARVLADKRLAANAEPQQS